MNVKRIFISSAVELLGWTWITRFSQRKAWNWWTSLSIHVSSSSWCADKFTRLRDLNCLRLWLTHDGLTDFFRFNDDARLTDDLGIRNDFLHVDDSRLLDHNFLAYDAWHFDSSRLVDESWLTNLSRFGHNMFVDHSSLCVNHFLLANNARRLLNFHELRPTLLRWTDLRTLWHGAEILGCVAF